MKLDHLTNDELMSFGDGALASERHSVAKLIAFLREVETRRLHLEHAYSSMQDFCIRGLGLTENETFRRLVVARMSVRFPQIIGALASGAIYLSSLVELRPVMNETNADTLLEQAKGKTKIEVMELVASLAPKPDVASSITPLPEDAQRTLPSTEPTCDQQTAPFVPQRSLPATPLSPGRYKVELTASEALRAKLGRLQELMRHRNPTGDLAFDLEVALDDFLPRLEKQLFAETTRPREADNVNPPRDPGAVTASARRETFDRDGKQCAYVSPKGQRCVQRGMLEIDHHVARAHGGVGHDARNLRVYCKAHNQLAAEKVFGRTHVAKKIAERRAAAAAKKDATTENIAQAMCTLSPATEPSTEVTSVADAIPDGEAAIAATRATVAKALVGLGFRSKEIDRALDLLAASGWRRPLADLLREGILALTPT